MNYKRTANEYAAERRIYNKTWSAKLYKEDTLNSSKLIEMRPGTIWLHFTQLKNFLTEMTSAWNFTESEQNKCLCHSPLYKSELLLNLFLLSWVSVFCCCGCCRIKNSCYFCDFCEFSRLPDELLYLSF